MRALRFVGVVAFALSLGLAFELGRKDALAQDHDELPDKHARGVKDYLGHMTTSGGVHYVLKQKERCFVVESALDDCVVLAELESRDGQPIVAGDSTPEAERVRVTLGNDTFLARKAAFWMVPVASVYSVVRRPDSYGRQHFSIRLAEAD